MSTASSMLLAQQAALGAVLAETAAGVVQAQRRLDEDAVGRTTAYVMTPQGEITLPPLWYTFSEVNVQLEMAATMTRVAAVGASRAGVRLDCRLVNPAAVGLFGYAASSGVRVSMTLAPREVGGGLDV